MRYLGLSPRDRLLLRQRFKDQAISLCRKQVPSWLALLLVSGLALVLTGCFSARQTYGLDQKSLKNSKVQLAQAQADPIITGALPSASSQGWAPHFYAGTGVKPGQPEAQSKPFTPKGIGSTAGMPPKPNVAPVDLPAPPLPLPESTAAPSTTLFSRGGIGRQTGFSARGSNFGGTALGRVPRFHQPSYQSSLKVFPPQQTTPQAGFRVANNQAGPAFAPLGPKPLPYAQFNQRTNIAAPQPPAIQPRPNLNVPAPIMQRPQIPPQNLQVFNNKVQAPVQPITGFNPQMVPRPNVNIANNMGAYTQRPIPKGANLIVTGNGYRIDTGDELNIRVLGQQDLTGRYRVDSTGAITMPMISTVRVRGRTVSQVSNMIQSRLRQGFLRTPSVSVEVIQARPFFILGQVKQPGKYNFVNGLTVSQAIAIAGGYQPRARKGMVRVTRQTPQGPITAEVPNEEPLMPGDTIYVKQRWF